MTVRMNRGARGYFRVASAGAGGGRAWDGAAVAAVAAMVFASGGRARDQALGAQRPRFRV